MSDPSITSSPEMSQKTECELTAEQHQAVQLLVIGKSCTEVAETLGKDRRSIYRWRQNPHFVAEFNRQCKEIYETGQTRLHGLLHKAISVVENQLDNGSFKAAMEVLRLLNVTPKTLKPDYETDAEAIAAKEAEKIAISVFNTTPFAQENRVIGVYPDEKQRALAEDIFGLIKGRYQVSTKLEEFID